jgi:hypothetical protein
MASNLPAVRKSMVPAKRGGLLKILFGAESDADRELREAIDDLERGKTLAVATLRTEAVIHNAYDQAQLAKKNAHLKNRAYAAMERETDMQTLLEELDFLDLAPIAKLRLMRRIKQMYGANGDYQGEK